MVMSEMVEQCAHDNSSVPLPEGVRVQTVSRERFSKYRETLSGLIPDNF